MDPSGPSGAALWVSGLGLDSLGSSRTPTTPNFERSGGRRAERQTNPSYTSKAKMHGNLPGCRNLSRV
jgi:hypothetical protein